MKLRYNHETKQWDIVLTQEAYGHLIHELESLRAILSRQINPPRPLGPYEVPNPHLTQNFKCSNPCNCSGACFKRQFERNPFIQTWCNINVPSTSIPTFLGTGGN